MTTRTHYPDLLFFLNDVCLAKIQQNTNSIVIGLTGLRLELTI